MKADPTAMLTLADQLRDMGVTLNETARKLDGLQLQLPTNDYIYQVAQLPKAFGDFRLHWSGQTSACVELCHKITEGLMNAAAAIEAADEDSAAQVRR